MEKCDIVDIEKINWDKEADVCEAKEYCDYYDLGEMSELVRDNYDNEFYVLVHESFENAIANRKSDTILDSVCFRINLKKTDNIIAFYADAHCESLYIKKGDCIIVQLIDGYPVGEGVYMVKTENGVQYKYLDVNTAIPVVARVLEIRRRFI